MILPSVRAFLDGIIDYAGLFPPAKLPLDRAIANYAEYRAGRDAWMLGRFVIPASRLAELGPHVALFSARSPLPLSVVGRGGETVLAFMNGITADLAEAAPFLPPHGSAVLADHYEVKLPDGEVPSRAVFLLGAAAKGLSRVGLSPVYEVPASAPAELFQRMRGGEAGVKLRCGGLEAAAFPSPAQLAPVITACRDNGLSLKFTAGLHHPMRHFDRDVSAKMHGFVNVFGAGVLAHAGGLTTDQVREIIEEEDPSHFGFDEIGFGWKHYHALTDEIIAARRQFVVSFGSCSFDEPRADLRAMGILP